MNSLDVKTGLAQPFRDFDIAPEMVVIPPGEFLMGSLPTEHGHTPSEGPRHLVRFAKPFALGRTAMTFGHWDAAVACGACDGYSPDDHGWGRGDRPVINVSWNDAQAYVEWLAGATKRPYRLPSEAEWEHAARAGSQTPFWWGKSISADQANYDSRLAYGGGPKSDWLSGTVPASCYDTNPWGLFNMHGNVWEWTEDCYRADYVDAPTNGRPQLHDPLGDEDRTLRGGSWLDRPKRLRSAARQVGARDDRNYCFGFRVALSL